LTSDKGVVERLQRELAEAQSGHDAARQTFHIMQGAANSLRIRAENAEARIETLERALRLVRDAITAPVNALAITDTVWMPLPQNAASSFETMVDFIDAALSPSTNGADNDDSSRNARAQGN